MKSYEEILTCEGFFLKETKGISMEPMLRQGRDQSLIRRVERELRKYDVVLFRRKNGQYVLHRIVGKRNGLFRIRGDNCMTEELVEQKQIIGILEGYYRGQTYVDCCKDLSYKAYVRKRVNTYPLRYILCKGKGFSNAAFRRVKRFFKK